MSSILRIEQQQKKIFLFTSISKSLSSLSSSFGIEYVLPSKTTPNSRPKWAKSTPVFRPKPLKNHTLWGSTYPWLNRRVPPPPRPKQGCAAKQGMVLGVLSLKFLMQGVSLGQQKGVRVDRVSNLW